MRLKAEIEKRTLHFKRPATTSRGSYLTRTSWFVNLVDEDEPRRCGVGECAPLPDLSCDAVDDYENRLRGFCDILEATGDIPYDRMKPFPSMLFGMETALVHLERGCLDFFDTPFGKGQCGITINGLVWMGDYERMLAEMEKKLDDGFKCIKLKIGAIDFDKEVDMMKRIRKRFDRDTVELRLDANGAFSAVEVMRKLDMLAPYEVHSIEQPIRQGQWEAMRLVCENSPIPIALDEELIGVNSTVDKQRLLEAVNPQYIILKPSLHGGMKGVRQWVGMARERGIGSWITSALESNVGLNAIAQLAADVYRDGEMMPQGLGTGQLFTDNIPYPLEIKGDSLYCKV